MSNLVTHPLVRSLSNNIKTTFTVIQQDQVIGSKWFLIDGQAVEIVYTASFELITNITNTQLELHDINIISIQVANRPNYHLKARYVEAVRSMITSEVAAIDYEATITQAHTYNQSA